MADSTLRERLQGALTDAMKRRDARSMAALRSALSAIANAEAVSAPAPAGTPGSPIAGAITGLGKGDVPRRELTEDEVARIVQGEIDDRLSAAQQYESAGHQQRADRLRAEAQTIASATHRSES